MGGSNRQLSIGGLGLRPARQSPPGYSRPHHHFCPHSVIARPHRHSRESGNPHPATPTRRGHTGVLDSGLRRNDGGGWGIRPPIRHSRESGNPQPGLSPRRGAPGFWIPAYAGMTVGGGLHCRRLAVGGVSPSPDPLPLGEGFGGLRHSPASSLSFRPPLTAIPSSFHRHSIRPPPSFRRMTESRTPVRPGLSRGRGVDSRFRGNDGMGRVWRDIWGGNDGRGRVWRNMWVL